jgi:type VI secretion system protein ImpA
LILDTAQLLVPITADRPTGVNVRQDVDGGAVYYRIKAARSAARIAERQADAEAERGPYAAEWNTILDLSQDILLRRGKDLEVASWLAEAALRIHGFAGLRDAFAVIDGLIERYWDSLHSLDQNDIATKVAPLAGLNGLDAEGALIQPLRLAPLTALHGGEAAGLWHYMVMRKRGPASREGAILANAVKATDSKTFKELYTDICSAAQAHAALTRRLDVICAEDSPPSSTIRNTLVEAQDALRDMSGLSHDALTDEPAAAQAPERTAEAPPEPAPAIVQPVAGPPPLRTREDALQELSRIATFFREHEPNATTAYSIETLIRRARMPLGDLLQELIPDEAMRRAYLTVAGIWPEPPGG